VRPKTIGLTPENTLQVHHIIPFDNPEYLKKSRQKLGKKNNARFPLSYSNLAQHMVPGQRQVTLHQVIGILQSIPAQRK
jgi:hypothetical protein